MDQKQVQAKWEGKVSARLVKSSVNQIWPLFTDFFNIHKWFPGVETCYAVHGNNGEPGCIRYCSSGSIKTSSNDVVKPPSWAKERLIAVDHDEHTLIYEVLENNIGFESYVATIKIVPGGEEDSPRGCVIEWSFAVDPIEGWALDDMERQYDEWLHLIADKMEGSHVNSE